MLDFLMAEISRLFLVTSQNISMSTCKWWQRVIWFDDFCNAMTIASCHTSKKNIVSVLGGSNTVVQIPGQMFFFGFKMLGHSYTPIWTKINVSSIFPFSFFSLKTHLIKHLWVFFVLQIMTTSDIFPSTTPC